MTAYLAATTTGIYCHPGCSARPRAEHVVAFDTAAAAEAARYRACLRCRPYRVAVDIGAGAPELVCRAVRLISTGALDGSMEAALGRRLGVSARHLRRLFAAHLGVTPSQLAVSRRAHFARRLLDDTDMPLTSVAFAAGFGSVRHFNRTMIEVFRHPPSELRRRRRRHDRLVTDGGLAIRIPTAPPYDWTSTATFLDRHAIPGIEQVDDGIYRRTIVIDDAPGVVEIGRGGADHLVARLHLPSLDGLVHIVDRLAQMVGLGRDLRPGYGALADDPVLGPLVRARPGVRIPGTWDGFEVGVHAIVAQHLTPSATRAALGRLVASLGRPVPGLADGLTHLFPTPQTVAHGFLEGLPPAATDTVTSFARAVADGSVAIDGSSGAADLADALGHITGIDTVAARHIAMRLGALDVLPLDETVDGLHPLSAQWHPWRSLAAAYLWTDAGIETKDVR